MPSQPIKKSPVVSDNYALQDSSVMLNACDHALTNAAKSLKRCMRWRRAAIGIYLVYRNYALYI